jgi:hypothetical protein
MSEAGPSSIYTVDWTNLDADLNDNAVDPASDVALVRFILWDLTAAELSAQICSGTGYQSNALLSLSESVSGVTTATFDLLGEAGGGSIWVGALDDSGLLLGAGAASVTTSASTTSIAIDSTTMEGSP